MEPNIVAALISGGIAIISLTVSLVVNAHSNGQNKKINEHNQLLKKQGNEILELTSSKDYELVENVKSDILTIIAVLHTISKTPIYMKHMPQEINIDSSAEYETLRKIKNSASYLYLLKALKEKYDDNQNLYFWFDVRFNILLMSRNQRTALQLLKTIAESRLDFDTIEKYKVQDVYSEFAHFSVVGYGREDDDSIDTNNSTLTNKPKSVFESFIIHLVDELSCDNPDVLLFYSVFRNEPEMTQKALDDGANTRCTDKMIVEKYRKEYEAFVS